MQFFRIAFDKAVNNHNDIYVAHANGSQSMYTEIEHLAPGVVCANGFPLSLELDGWADDQACEGDTFETDEGFTVECISEDTFREETRQQDVPTYLLQNC